MTGLTVQSSILGIAGGTVPPAGAASLALFILGNARNRNNNDNNFDSHAPVSRRRKKGGVPSSSSRSGNKPKQTTTPSNNSKISSTDKQHGIGLYRRWMDLPQIFRFFVAGNLGTLGFFYLEKVIFRLLSHMIVTTTMLSSALMDGIEKYQDGLSFFSAYVIQIVTTHLLYALLVYGMDTISTYEKYSKTLSGQFKVYGVGLFGATFLNSFLISSVGLEKTIAFWATTATFAFFNYFLVSLVVKKAMDSSSTGSIGSEANVPAKPPRRRKKI